MNQQNNCKPKNSFETFKWSIFEPILLKRYSASLTRRESMREFLKAYIWVVAITITIYCTSNFIKAVFDLPILYKNAFDPEIVNNWPVKADFLSKFLFISKTSIGWLASGLALGLAFGLASGLALGLANGLALGLVFGLALGLSTGLAMTLGWLLGNLRIFPFYIYYLFTGMYRNHLNRNPYWQDSLIWLPILGLKSKLLRRTSENPEEAARFIDFLIEYRPLQKNLAMFLTHTAIAGKWRLHPLDADILKELPLISKDKPKFKPSDQWFQTITTLREELLASQQQNSIGLKMEYFERFQVGLEQFREITLKQESSRWNHYYLDTLTQWQQCAQEEHQRLQQIAQTTEPITRNYYRAGPSLDPQFDQPIFMERHDLKESLQQKILASPQMPLFLIHGQRRVGKTTLLKFLPHILGPRFKVVVLDLLDLDNVHQWFTDLQKTFHETLQLPIPLPLPDINSNWSQTWKILQSQLETAAAQKDYKIILAFDEYEKLHRRLQTSPAEAADLLDAMRSFSQHQNKIVFLFVGATFFSELDQPRWSDYFVQAVLLEVDYLTAPQTRRLIEVAGLDYPDDVIQQIYYLTQGHPTLVQRICHEIVDIANTSHRSQMTAADLNQVLESHVYRPQNGVTDVFWRQFCENPALKQAVREIIAGTVPTDKKALFSLREHGFILPEKEFYRLRVPIFHTWIEQFGDFIT